MLSGRETELHYLNSYYKKEGSQIMIVYGQKGIGKTTLLNHFLENKSHLYYEALCCSTRQQLFYLGRHLENIGFSMSEYPSFEEVFSVLETESDKKQILVIDEFQNMCKTDTEFFVALYNYLRKKDKSSIYIVLCSSSIGWVENTMISKLGGLARMLSGFLKVKELKYRDFEKHFPNFTKEDSIGAYSILGGIPGLWQYFNDEFTLKENIEQFILQSNERLFDYGQQYVSEELRETAVYNTILCALASGKRKLNDLYSHTGFSRAKISVYLKNLMQLEIVEKVFSLDTEGREHTQKGIYQISHPYVHFYYRYLFPNITKLAYMEAEEFYNTYIAPTFREYTAAFFVQVCIEFFEKENNMGRLPEEYNRVGQWFGKDGTIDFIFQDDNNNTLAGICNWEKEMMTFDDYERFLLCQEKAKIKAEYMILCSATTFENQLKAEERQNPHLALLTLDKMK